MGTGSGSAFIQGTANLAGVSSLDGGSNAALNNTLTFDNTSQSLTASVLLTNWKQINLQNSASVTLQSAALDVQGNGTTYNGAPIGLNFFSNSTLATTAAAFTLTGNMSNSGRLSLQNGTVGNTFTVSNGNYVGNMVYCF